MERTFDAFDQEGHRFEITMVVEEIRPPKDLATGGGSHIAGYTLPELSCPGVNLIERMDKGCYQLNLDDGKQVIVTTADELAP